MPDTDVEMQTSLGGKAVVVTGGTTGIGRAVVARLAKEGARVIMCGRHEPELQDALRGFEGAGDVHGLAADTARHEDVLRLFQEADARLGGVDILVSNAAIAAKGIRDMDYSEAEYAVRVNLLGYMDCAREALSRMAAKGRGHLLCIGSMSADVKEAGSSVYVATKAGIAGFCDSLRKEVNEAGVRVTLVEPGKVITDMNPGTDAEVRDGKALLAEDVAECVHHALTRPFRQEIALMEVRPHLQVI